MDNTSDLLSEIADSAKKKTAKYTRLAVFLSISNLLVFIAMVVNAMVMIMHISAFRQISRILSWILFTTILGGTIASLLSYVKKEKKSKRKTIAAVINFLLFLVFLASFIYVLTRDMNRMHS